MVDFVKHDGRILSYFTVGVDAACSGAGVDTVLVDTALVAAALAVVYRYIVID